MKNKLSEKQRQLHKTIGEILWKDWDPLVLNQYDNWPTDEYEDEASAIFSLKIKGASAQVIAQKLDEFETKRMGQDSRLEKSKQVAEKLFNL